MDTPSTSPFTPAPAPMTPPVTPVPAPTSPSSRSNKGVIAVVVVIALLIGGYLAWAMSADSWPFAPAATESPSPSPSAGPTAGWKTYTNTQYGYTVKYPGDYIVDPFGPPADSGTASTFVLEGSEEGPLIMIAVYDSVLSASDWLRSSEGLANLGGDLSGHNIGTYTIGQRVVVTAHAKELGNSLDIFSDSGRIVVFSGGSVAIPHAISTFHFTGPTAGWKTYTNTQYGFEVKYPNDWAAPRIENGQTVLMFSGPNPPVSSILIKLKIFPAGTSVGKGGPQWKPTTLGGRSAFVWDRTSKFSGGLDRNVVVPLGDGLAKELNIETVANVAIVNQILSTFKFTK